MLTADYTRVDTVGWREAVSARQAPYFPQSSAASRLTSANAPSDGLQNPRRATRFLIEIEAE
jgi:hypothetical protein